MVAEFVTFADLARKNFRVPLSLFADDEKRGRNVFVLEDVEDRGGIGRVGAVVKGKHDLFLVR